MDGTARSESIGEHIAAELETKAVQELEADVGYELDSRRVESPLVSLIKSVGETCHIESWMIEYMYSEEIQLMLSWIMNVMFDDWHI